MCTNVSSFKRCKENEKICKIKNRLRDLDYVFFWPTFLLLIFYSLQFIYMLNKTPVALAVSELFTTIRKFKMYPRDIALDPCDLVLL